MAALHEHPTPLTSTHQSRWLGEPATEVTGSLADVAPLIPTFDRYPFGKNARLDMIVRHGPISPTALARRVGVHLATMSGILARLESGGWIVRDRVANDRRAVLVRGVPDKQRDIVRLYGGMNSALDGILASYSDDQIELVVDFLTRCTEAGQQAADRFAENSLD